ncbi:MAG: hypothetical protein ABR985_07890 [Methanotrichaceae archaeon]|jgi:hypothetical protein
MRKLIIFWLVLLSLALNCEATAPVQLSGTGGQTILAQVASTNITNQVTKSSDGELWNWGDLPLNKVLDKTGKIFDIANEDGSDDGNVWLAAKSKELGGLNLSAYI